MAEHLDSLAAVADRYDAVLCDIWGVVHNGRRVFAQAVRALSDYRARGGRVVLVSNVPKPRDPIFGQLDRIGCPRTAYDDIITSGDAIRFELRARAPGPMFRIGPDNDDVLWQGLGVDETPHLADAAFVGVSGLNDPFGETVDSYAGVLAAARARGLDMLCANPDIVVRVGDRLMLCAGAIAEAYAAQGGRVIMAGKPHPPIYRLALDAVNLLAGRTVPAQRILAIGDGAATDVLGANRAGLDALFIASGIHGDGLKGEDGLDDGKIAATLAKDGATARYVMEHLT